MKNSIVKKSDIVFAFAIIAVMLLVFFLLLPNMRGTEAVFRQNGKIIKVLALNYDTEFEIYGAYHNEFIIKDGEVFVAHSNCPNHQCEKFGRISSVGQSIVCVPNGVSVTIEDGREADTDAISE